MRRRIWMVIFGALSGLLLACGSSTTPNTARISGTVTASSLGPQSGVGVTLGRATPPEPLLRTSTGAGGGFEFTGLARGAVFYLSAPFDLQLMMAAGTNPHRFTITFDGGGRYLTGTCLIIGSRVDSLQLNGSNEVPGVAGLEYSSQPPDVYPPPVAAPPDSVLLASASGQARLAGRMTTYWHLVAIYGDLRQNVVLYFDVTRTGR